MERRELLSVVAGMAALSAVPAGRSEHDGSASGEAASETVRSDAGGDASSVRIDIVLREE